MSRGPGLIETIHPHSRPTTNGLAATPVNTTHHQGSVLELEPVKVGMRVNAAAHLAPSEGLIEGDGRHADNNRSTLVGVQRFTGRADLPGRAATFCWPRRTQPSGAMRTQSPGSSQSPPAARRGRQRRPDDPAKWLTVLLRRDLGCW